MFRQTRGQLWPLLTVLCLVTAVVSAFLDNVTTVMLMTPVVVKLCEKIDVDPVKILIATVVFSNIGGCATPGTTHFLLWQFVLKAVCHGFQLEISVR